MTLGKPKIIDLQDQIDIIDTSLAESTGYQIKIKPCSNINDRYYISELDGEIDYVDLNQALSNGEREFIFPSNKQLYLSQSIDLTGYSYLKFHGNGATLRTDLDIPIFYGYDMSYIVIENLFMRKPLGANYTVALENSRFGTIRNCFFESYTNEGTTENSVAGVAFTKRDTLVAGYANRFLSNRIQDGCLYMRTTDGSIQDNLIYARALHTPALNVERSAQIITGNQFVGNDSGCVLLNGVYGIMFANNSVDGGDLTVNSGVGITLKDTDEIGINIINNIIYMQASSAIVLDNAKNVVIDSNIFTDNNKLYSGKADIVISNSDVTNCCVITKNRFSNIFGDKTNDYYMIEKDSINSIAIVKDNIFTDNNSGYSTGTHLNHALLDSNCIIKDNILGASVIFETPFIDAATQSIALKGFATRFANHGNFDRADIFAIVYSPTASTIEVVCKVFDDSFNLIATATKTVEKVSPARLISFDFNETVNIVGDNFYLGFYVTDVVNCGCRVPQTESAYSSADITHRNKYTTDGATWGDVSSSTPKAYSVNCVLYEKKYKLKNSENIIYVGKQSEYDYNTIQSAIDSITDDSENNPYVIYIMPGTYERFSMIDNDNRLHYISLIGFDRTTTIIKSDTGTYETPPAEIWTNGTIENLTFIMETSAGTYTGQGGQLQAYAVHQDFGTCETLYKNCVMISNSGSAGGFGTFQDGKMIFHDCDFICNCDNTYGTNTLGALFIHCNSETPDTNQYAEFRNCNAINKYGTDGFRLRIPTGAGGSYSILVQNCLSWGVSGASAFVNTGILDVKSFGNNISSLNA